MRIAAFVFLTVLGGVACGRSRPTWGLSGQSNADYLRPHLAPYADVAGYAVTSVPIACYAVDGECWKKLEPTIHRHMDAFLWWQGESDICLGCDGFLDAAGAWQPTPGAYASKLADVVQRVRRVARNPRLFVVVMQLYDGRLDGEQAAFVAADGHAVVVPTRDIGFDDGAHMVAAQYQAVARRIATVLKAVR